MGTNAVIFTSLDGATWSKIDLASNQTFNDLSFLDAVIWTGASWLGFARKIGETVVIRSLDMVTLDRITFPNIDQTNAVAVGNGLIIATGFSNSAISDDDGLTWVQGSYNNVNYKSPFIAFGNNIFLVTQTTTHGFGPVIIQSTVDGQGYTTLATIADIGQIQGLRFFNGRFYIIATDTGNTNNVIFTSPDGVTWTKHVIAVANGIFMADLCFGNGMYLLIPQSDGFPCYTSANGNSWTTGASLPSASAFYVKLAFTHGVFVAITNNNNGFLATTSNGNTWTPINPTDATGVDFADIAAR